MNFISNVLDSVPVVGHVKGMVHYLAGDEEGGNTAMYQSTRTSFVLVGGAIGCVAGPAGAVAGAISAGACTDCVGSVIKDEPQGIIRGCTDIVEDFNAGRNPAGSIVSTAFQVALDGVGGYGMNGLSGVGIAVNASEKTLANAAGQQAIKKGTEQVVKKGAEQVALQVVSANILLKAAHNTGREEQERRQNEERAERERLERAERERLERAERERLERAERERLERAERERLERERERLERAERERLERAERERLERAERERLERAEIERPERAERQRPERAERERPERAERARLERAERERCASEQEEQAPSGSGSGSQQPPQGNGGNNENSNEVNNPDNFKVFIELLKQLLIEIYGNQEEPFSGIFENLTQGQKDYLTKIIEKLMANGAVDAVIKLVLKIFKNHMAQDISFTNFLSLLEFVQTYIMDEVDLRLSGSRGTETGKPKLKYKERRAKIIDEIQRQGNIITVIFDLFVNLRNEIEAETLESNNISPNFRDIFAAVYHYFKHRCVPGYRELSVKEYYDWIRKLLEKLKKTPEYAELENRGRGRIVYDVYVELFDRRFRIVVTVQNRKIVLSSAFVVSMQFPKDKKEDFFIRK